MGGHKLARQEVQKEGKGQGHNAVRPGGDTQSPSA
jgi:hypothetical protein